MLSIGYPLLGKRIFHRLGIFQQCVTWKKGGGGCIRYVHLRRLPAPQMMMKWPSGIWRDESRGECRNPESLTLLSEVGTNALIQWRGVHLFMGRFISRARIFDPTLFHTHQAAFDATSCEREREMCGIIWQKLDKAITRLHIWLLVIYFWIILWSIFVDFIFGQLACFSIILSLSSYLNSIKRSSTWAYADK